MEGFSFIEDAKMGKIHSVDVLVWKNNLLPTKPRPSLTTGFKATNCGTVPTFGHAPTRDCTHAQSPQRRPLRAVTTAVRLHMEPKTGRAALARSRPQRKSDFTKTLRAGCQAGTRRERAKAAAEVPLGRPHGVPLPGSSPRLSLQVSIIKHGGKEGQGVDIWFEAAPLREETHGSRLQRR